MQSNSSSSGANGGRGEWITASWKCGMCDGLRLVPDMDDETRLFDCPKCAFAATHEVAFEIYKRNIAPAASPGERAASPAVSAPTFNYELWQFDLIEGKARPVLVSWDVGEVYRTKWDFEEQLHGKPVGA